MWGPRRFQIRIRSNLLGLLMDVMSPSCSGRVRAAPASGKNLRRDAYERRGSALLALTGVHLVGELVGAEDAGEPARGLGGDAGEGAAEAQWQRGDLDLTAVLLDPQHDGLGDVLGCARADAGGELDV